MVSEYDYVYNIYDESKMLHNRHVRCLCYVHVFTVYSRLCANEREENVVKQHN